MGIISKTTSWVKGLPGIAKAALDSPMDGGNRNGDGYRPFHRQLGPGLEEKTRGGEFLGVRRRSYALIREMSEADLDTSAIISALVGFATTTKWHIAPKLEQQKDELSRWGKMEMANLQPASPDEDGGQGKPPKPIEFESKVLDPEVQELCRPKLDAIANAALEGKLTYEVAVRRMNVVLSQGRAFLEQKSWGHAHEVEKLFRQPNQHEERDWQTFIRYVLYDLLTYDMACIGLGRFKNKSRKGLAEMFWVPADEIVVVRTKETDRVPDAPKPAWVRKKKLQPIAEYDTDHMLNLRRHPSKDGYGLSPIERIVGSIAGSFQIQKENLDEIKAAYMSSAIIGFEHGGSVDDQAVRAAGMQRRLFGGLPGDVAEVSPIDPSTKVWNLPGRGQRKDASFLEYRHELLAEKCRAYDLSPQDIGFVADFHRTTSETQWDISQVRAIQNLLVLLQEAFNQHIIWKYWPYKDVQFVFEALEAEQNSKEQMQQELEWVREGVMTRAAVAEKHNMPTYPGQDVPTKSTGAGELLVEKIEQYYEQVMVGGQEAAGPQGAEQMGGAPGAGGGGQPAPTPNLMTPGAEEGAPGVPAGMSGQQLYPELANPFAIQQMAKGVTALGREVDRRLGEVALALADGDSERAKSKADLLQRHLKRDVERMIPNGEMPVSAAAETLAMLEELKATANMALTEMGGA